MNRTEAPIYTSAFIFIVFVIIYMVLVKYSQPKTLPPPVETIPDVVRIKQHRHINYELPKADMYELFDEESLPVGVMFDEENGVITGTPKYNGKYSIKVRPYIEGIPGEYHKIRLTVLDNVLPRSRGIKATASKSISITATNALGAQTGQITINIVDPPALTIPEAGKWTGVSNVYNAINRTITTIPGKYFVSPTFSATNMTNGAWYVFQQTQFGNVFSTENFGVIANTASSSKGNVPNTGFTSNILISPSSDNSSSVFGGFSAIPIGHYLQDNLKTSQAVLNVQSFSYLPLNITPTTTATQSTNTYITLKQPTVLKINGIPFNSSSNTNTITNVVWNYNYTSVTFDINMTDVFVITGVTIGGNQTPINETYTLTTSSTYTIPINAYASGNVNGIYQANSTTVVTTTFAGTGTITQPTINITTTPNNPISYKISSNIITILGIIFDSGVFQQPGLQEQITYQYLLYEDISIPNPIQGFTNSLYIGPPVISDFTLSFPQSIGNFLNIQSGNNTVQILAKIENYYMAYSEALTIDNGFITTKIGTETETNIYQPGKGVLPTITPTNLAVGDTFTLSGYTLYVPSNDASLTPYTVSYGSSPSIIKGNKIATSSVSITNNGTTTSIPTVQYCSYIVFNCASNISSNISVSFTVGNPSLYNVTTTATLNIGTNLKAPVFIAPTGAIQINSNIPSSINLNTYFSGDPVPTYTSTSLPTGFSISSTSLLYNPNTPEPVPVPVACNKTTSFMGITYNPSIMIINNNTTTLTLTLALLSNSVSANSIGATFSMTTSSFPMGTMNYTINQPSIPMLFTGYNPCNLSSKLTYNGSNISLPVLDPNNNVVGNIVVLPANINAVIQSTSGASSNTNLVITMANTSYNFNNTTLNYIFNIVIQLNVV